MQITLDDFGFTFFEEGEPQPTDSGKLDNRASRMMTVIQPLLSNLKRNPKAQTIKWPDRIQKITEIEQQLNDILEGEAFVDT